MHWLHLHRRLVYPVMLALASAAAGLGAVPRQFTADCQRLTGSPHRRTGSTEYTRAANYVEQRLRQIGADRIIVQEFPTVSTVVKRCELLPGDSASIDSTPALRLYPMRPNGIVPPVTPPEGITGPIVYAGEGDAEQLERVSPKGCVVVLDYNCGRGWMRAFRLGAKAVVFVSNGPDRAWNPHYVDGNVNLPRFYYAGPAEDLTRNATGTIHSEVVWEKTIGRNVLGFFRGTAPVFHLDKEEIILASANLDTYGEVPQLSPGARGGANCAALLALAERFRRRPPRRHLLVAFFDNQAHGHAGATAFYIALEDDDDKMTVEARQECVAEEKAFVYRLQEALRVPSLAAVKGGAERELISRLQRHAANHVYAIKDETMDLRLATQDIQGNLEALRGLKSQIQDREERKTRWNEVRRALARRVYPDSIADLLSVVEREVSAEVRQREEELRLDERMLQTDAHIKELIGSRWITVHLSLLLGDRTSTWAFMPGGDTPFHSPKDLAGLYGRLNSGILTAAKELQRRGRGLRHFLSSSVDGSLIEPRVLLAAPHLIHGGEVAGNYGVYNLAIGTVQEDLGREGTPDDRLEALNTRHLWAQAGEVASVLIEAAGLEDLSLSRAFSTDRWYKPVRFVGTKLKGPQVMATSPGSSVPNRQVPGAIVQQWFFQPLRTLGYKTVKPYAFDPFYVRATDANGSYLAGPVMRNKRGFTAEFDSRGAVTQATGADADWRIHWRQDIYPCNGGFALLPPIVGPATVNVLDGDGNGQLKSKKSNAKTSDGLVRWFADEEVEAVKLFGEDALVCLVNGPDTIGDRTQAPDDPVGTGLPVQTLWRPHNSAVRSAADLWRLNESRLRLLRSKGIVERSLEDLHGRSEKLLSDVKNTPSLPRREALSTSAFMMERTVYGLLRRSLDDLVRAVLVLLALAVPFAFALERLLIGSPVIFRQLAWFCGFFLLTFLVLFFSHPAFGISAVPVVIFLGFGIVVLSAFVIVILMRKFEFEIKKLQGMTTTVHAADVSRFGTVVAAMNMGISTMRRRPLRTALTAVTIVLLTFTILCFASFGARLGIIKVFLGQPPAYAGVFVHKVDWQAITPDFLDILQTRWSKATVCPRYWIAPKPGAERGLPVTRADGTRPVVLEGVLGIERTELDFRTDIARALGKPGKAFDTGIWMTASVADLLGVNEGDSVLFAGKQLRVGKPLRPERLLRIRDLDNSELLPVDFVEMQSSAEQQPKQGVGGEEFDESFLAPQETVDWTTLPVDLTVVVSANTAAKLGAALHAVSLYTEDRDEAAGIAESLARMMRAPVCGTRDDGVYNHVLGPVIKASGIKGLIFPILLGGLVIFGTMLGSVSDREKEIYSYTALGLAPPHVAGLFFAEALVYAVVGGMGGYLISQALMKVLGYLSQFGFVRVPEMNYSSSNAVMTILLVMGTVLVSTIYPALKASRSANPGVMRTWRMPKAEGDTLNIVFPFTVSTYDFTGVVSFLKEHFDQYADTGLGVFMATDSRVTTGENGALGVEAQLALAPFDLGVTEAFRLSSSPSAIEGIDQVRIEITRVSGQPRDWYRLNKVLLAELRKQFLIWRSLKPETMEMYRRRTLARTT